jgi:hypothetical protein
MWRRDHRHLENRMASLRLEPDQHPSPSDTPRELAMDGIWAARRARLPRRRKLLLGGWFALSGLLPRRLARPFVTWYLDKRSRPPIVQRMMGVFRKMSR